MKFIIRSFVLVMSLTVLTNCSTVHKSVKYSRLDVQTKMSETVFLDPVAESKKTVFLQLRNTSDKQDLQVAEGVRHAIQSQGYRIVTDPDQAHYMIQANILQVGRTREDSDGTEAGFGGAVAGGAVGAMAGQSYTGMGIGALAGGLMATVADAAIQVVNYQMVTDLQISERAGNTQVVESNKGRLKQGTSGYKKSRWKEQTNWKKYQTRIISTAEKTNLKFEQALPELEQGLVGAIAGIL